MAKVPDTNYAKVGEIELKPDCSVWYAMGRLRSFSFGKKRRMLTLRLDRQDWPQREIIKAMDITLGAVSQWLRADAWMKYQC